MSSCREHQNHSSSGSSSGGGSSSSSSSSSTPLHFVLGVAVDFNPQLRAVGTNGEERLALQVRQQQVYGVPSGDEEFVTLRPALESSVKAFPSSSHKLQLLTAEHGARTTGRGWRSPQPKADRAAPCDTYKHVGSYLRFKPMLHYTKTLQETRANSIRTLCR
jgi:hypothetical protein